MKDTFSDNNFTQSDVANALFKKSWIRASSAEQDSKGKVRQRRLMTGGVGGYGAPSIIQYVEVQEEGKKEESSSSK